MNLREEGSSSPPLFWFSYGKINGVDYWSEEAEEKQGTIETTAVSAEQSSDTVTIKTQWEWQDAEHSPQAHSEQEFRFQIVDSVVLFESTIRLTATEGDLQFGDTKEGAFAVRVGDFMKVDAAKGGKIFNDRGFQNDAAWGKTARWVQYVGPAQKDANFTKDLTVLKTAGVTMLVHPDSFGYPGRWHVRSYGLFAHNPFGVEDFVQGQAIMDDQEKSRVGGFTLKAGDEYFSSILFAS